jgi:hypothetical protein
MTQQTRDRIAAAFDRELGQSPVPTGLMAQVLRETVRNRGDRESQHQRHAGRPWMVGLRGVGSLVAVLMVVVLIATVLVGGRVWRDWNQFNARPAPAAAVDPAQLAQLLAKPLHLPVVAAGATCPMGPQTTINYDGGPYDLYGAGPAYAIEAGLLGVNLPTWNGIWDMKLFVEPSVTGAVLIRAQDLQAHKAMGFAGQYAVGNVIGMASLAGKKFQVHPAAALDVRQPRFDTTLSGLNIWKFRVVSPDTPLPDLCVGYQVDGLNFSEVFVSYYRG